MVWIPGHVLRQVLLFTRLIIYHTPENTGTNAHECKQVWCQKFRIRQNKTKSLSQNPTREFSNLHSRPTSWKEASVQYTPPNIINSRMVSASLLHPIMRWAREHLYGTFLIPQATRMTWFVLMDFKLRFDEGDLFPYYRPMDAHYWRKPCHRFCYHLWHIVTWAPLQYPIRRLIVKSREVSKPRYW